MSTTIGVVDLPATPAGGNCPSEPLLAGRRFGGTTLLQWVAQRLTEAQAVDRTVILLGQEHAHLQELAPPHIAVHLSTQRDPLARLADVCQKYQATAIVRVSVDTPFVDPVLVDQLIREACETPCDYATYCANDGTSSIQNRLGLVAEWIGAAALSRANEEATGADRLRPTDCIWTAPDAYRLRFVRAPKPLDRQNLQLMIDSEDDWDNAHQIYEALGPDGIDWRRIAMLLGIEIESQAPTVNNQAS